MAMAPKTATDMARTLLEQLQATHSALQKQLEWLQFAFSTVQVPDSPLLLSPVLTGLLQVTPVAQA